MTREEEVARVVSILVCGERTMRFEPEGNAVWVQDVLAAARMRGFIRTMTAAGPMFAGQPGDPRLYKPEEVALFIVDDGRVRSRLGFGPRQALPAVAPANVLVDADLAGVMARAASLWQSPAEAQLCVDIRALLQELQNARLAGGTRVIAVRDLTGVVRTVAVQEPQEQVVDVGDLGDRTEADEPADVAEMAQIAADAAYEWLRQHQGSRALPIGRDTDAFALLVGAAELVHRSRG